MAKSMKDVRGKKGNTVIDKGEVQPVETMDDVKSMVKSEIVDKSGGLAKQSEVANLNPEFEGFDSVRPNTIKKDMNEFVIYTVETGEEIKVSEIEGIILSGKPAYSIWDKGNKKFYVSYDRQVAVTGEDWEEIKQRTGEKDNFRYHAAVLIPDLSDEPYSFMMSGTGFYNLKNYAEKLAEKGLKVANVITKIKLKAYKSDFGGYFAEIFESVAPVEE